MKKRIQINRVFLGMIAIVVILFNACKPDKIEELPATPLQLLSISIGTKNINLSDFSLNRNIETNKTILLKFSEELDVNSTNGAFILSGENGQLEYSLSFLDNNRSVTIIPNQNLPNDQEISLEITNSLKATSGVLFEGFVCNFYTIPEIIEIQGVQYDTTYYLPNEIASEIARLPVIKIFFSKNIDPASISSTYCKIVNAYGNTVPANLSLTGNILRISPTIELVDLLKHYIYLSSSIQGLENEIFIATSLDFYTRESDVLKFPEILDDELLDLVQEHTFQYFWSGAHPLSGMARERSTSGDLVTTGGTGFGLMALIVGIERGFITRNQGVERITTIVNFLENANRFHGVWPHWMNGNTGIIFPFSANDNGGDLVETAFLAQGLITARQYLEVGNPQENNLITNINGLLDGIEWDWYTKDGSNVLYWHWSPTVGWAMNMPIRGYNEALITYVMAATSVIHSINQNVYQEGWARSGDIINNKEYYGINLPVGYDYGGPLFFAHYSFLGLDPRNLKDQYADYWVQNVAHTSINRQHCIINPQKYIAYGSQCWGLTASDEPGGYSAHSPTNDLGVISPTAAISSMPYTPEASMEAMRFFYYKLGDRTWGEYGFKDAFSVTDGWYAESYLAIDQGPQIIMIENHRSGLLWDLFMSAPEVDQALQKLGFTGY